ncbi:MAG TPA: hypothetical protein VGR37_03840 [Longimicrobiaceae bacterium]|nr:hypothetical protein [Longimicrobiaceae bacterium]
MHRIHITALLYFAALLWAVALLASGIELTSQHARPLGVVGSALIGLVAVFDLWLWRLRWLHGWFVKRPFLQGTWAVTLQSDWKDPESGQGVGPIQAYLAVRQTYTSISLRLMTAESSSKMLGSDIVGFPDGLYVVTGVYQAEPKLLVRHRSPIHYGAIVLNVRASPPDGLDGSYWTDRQTRGELFSTSYTRKVYDSFSRAATAHTETKSVVPSEIQAADRT